MTRKQQAASRLEQFERDMLGHLEVLVAAARRILRSQSEAEDMVQETYLRAWKYFDSFDAGSNARAWLFRIMFNAINRERGKRAKLAEAPLEEESQAAEQTNVIAFDPIKQLEGAELLKAAERLSEEHRAVLWLVVVDEFSYREAADILGVPIGTVMSRLHRARRELRKQIVTRTAGA